MRASLLASAIANMLRCSRSLLGPGPQPPHRCARPPLENDVRGLHEQCSQVLVAALGDLAQDCAIPRRLLLRHEPQPSAKVAALLESGAVADRLNSEYLFGDGLRV